MNLTKKIAIISATALSVSFFSGCDSDTPLNSNIFDILELDSRYDAQFLADNATIVAKMPANLISSDVITYSIDTVPLNLSTTFAENNVPPPKTDGLADWQLQPLNSGAISIEGRRYVYTGNNSSVNSATISMSPADRINGPVFDAGMASIAFTGAGISQSLSTVLTTNKYPVDSASIFSLNDEEKEAIRLAVKNLGYVAVDMPNANAVGRGSQINNGIRTVQVDVENIVVLNDRRITHTVTSTNAEILSTGIVRGTFEIIDTYYDLALEAQSGDSYYRVIIARNPTFSSNLQLQSIQPRETGTFELKMNNIINVNPNAN